MMKRDSDKTDELLRRSLKEAVGPKPLRDEEIESLSGKDDSIADEIRLGRILSGTRQLINENEQHFGGRLAVFADPKNVSTGTTEVTMQQLDNPDTRSQRSPRGAVAALMVSAMALMAVLLWTSRESVRDKAIVAERKAEERNHLLSLQQQWMTARYQPETKAAQVSIGDTIQTGARERRRVNLPDGSVLFVNEQTRARVSSARRIDVTKGEVYVEVAPSFDEGRKRDQFRIVTPSRTVTALGTRFGVDTSNSGADVLVTQGKVKVSGVATPVEAGQQLVAALAGKNIESTPEAAGRASEHLNWTRELMTAAAGVIVPVSEYAGGAIISVDPNGQKLKLSLRKYHVDVHIQDGFARTTIDQTYFNHTHSRLEGTFHFPLPSDASLSRLAMYVNGKLMEGGMAERQHARNTFEKIVHKMKDPALLEWVDGSTFKMRVFPLEARQEKRIILSYTQRLNSAYGRTSYRFPAGHSMDVVGEWSTRLQVTDGAKEEWQSPSHKLEAKREGRNLILSGSEKQSRMSRDLVVELGKSTAKQTTQASDAPLWSTVQHEGHKYLMLRFRPELKGKPKREPRHWVFLFEASADRNPVLARTQIEIIRTLLENAEHADTFNIVTANTAANAFGKSSVKCTAGNIRKAIQHLNQTHLIGALDLETALQKCESLCNEDRETLIVHTGSAIPVIGSHDQSVLLNRLPDNAAYVGVGVGKNWSRPFMKAAAGRSGGYFCQINPDEEVNWRSFELSSLLNTPRLLNIRVASGSAAVSEKQRVVTENSGFLNFADTVVQGEQVCAVTRIPAGQELPKSVTVAGLLNGRHWEKRFRVRKAVEGAEYLPRSWARLRIDQLVADSAAEHKSEIIRLSKAMYVMSPFTSLLVLENEQMYTQYNIDRGRKDHWALYDCPTQIKVVHEPVDQSAGIVARTGTEKSAPAHWLSTIRRLSTPVLTSGPGFVVPVTAGVPEQGWQSDRLRQWYVDRGQALNEASAVRYRLDAVNGSVLWEYQRPGEINLNGIADQTILSSMFESRAVNSRLDGELAFSVNGTMRGRPSRGLRRSKESDSDFLTRLGRTRSAVSNGPVPATVDELLVEIERQQQGQQQSVRGGTALNLRSDVSFEELNNLGAIILKGNPADVARVETAIKELESLQRATSRLESVKQEVKKIRESEIALRLAVPTISDHFSTINLSDGYIADDSGLSIAGNNLWREAGTVGFRVPSLPVSGDFDGDGVIDSVYLNFGLPNYGYPVATGAIGGKVAGIAPGQSVANWSTAYSIYPYYTVRGPQQFFDLNTNGDIELGSSQLSAGFAGGGFGFGTPRFNESGDMLNSYVLPPLQMMARPGPMIDGPGPGILGMGVPANEFAFGVNPPGQIPLGWSRANLGDDAWVFPGRPESFVRRARPELVARELKLRQLQKQLVAGQRASESKHPTEAESGKLHRWGKAAPASTDVPFVSLPAFSYTIPPYFGTDRRYFGDLMSHAPGLNTWVADILSIAAEQQDKDSEILTGRIDAAARKLIEQNRSRGWEKVVLTAPNGKESFSVMCNAEGAHTYQRVVSEGLTEEVYCDGKTLKHIYREIGLASERSWTSFHRGAIESVVPWLLPTVEELAVGSNVIAVDSNTIAIIPITRPDPVRKDKARKQELPDETDSDLPVTETHLVFSADGRLKERRLVNGKTKKILLRTIFEASGIVRVLSGTDKLITELRLQREPIDAPDLEPQLQDLVVLPMPIRSSEKVMSGRKDSAIENMTKKEQLRLILADSAEKNGARVVSTVEEQFLKKGDSRPGLYLLLSRFPNLLQRDVKVSETDGLIRHIDLRPSADRSPLLQFVRQYISWQLDKKQGPPNFDLEGNADGFVQRMATACNIYHRWNSGAAVNDRSKNQIKKDLSSALKFVSTCRTDAMGWTLMNAIQPKLSSASLNKMFAQAVKRFEGNPQLAAIAREARVKALFLAGEKEKGRDLYAEFLRADMAVRALPRISPELRNQFREDDGAAAWAELVDSLGRKLHEAKLPRAALLFAVKLRQLGDTEQADQLLELVLSDLDSHQRPDVALLAAEQLRLLSDGKANELLDSVQEWEVIQESAAFWRYAASVADALGKKQSALDRIEKAIQLEFNNRPEVINVERLRADYSNLFTRFEEIIDASQTLEAELPADLFARIIRAADQWRSLEDDPTTCCQATARLLTKLKRPELSWSYLTTPLAGRSGESAPWQQLAQFLGNQKQVDLADVAWATAFEFEQTNPEILYGHAMMLKDNGRVQESRQLLRKIVDSNWQPRFSGTRRNASSQLNQL